MKKTMGTVKKADEAAKPGKSPLRQGPEGPAKDLDGKLPSAVKELMHQHPEKHDDIGPHHERAKPLNQY